jgi:hypothetical protein
MGEPEIERLLLSRQTENYDRHTDTYKDIQFVFDDTYEHSIFINESSPSKSPVENNRCFLMEPPDIMRTHPAQAKYVKEYYSFNMEDKNVFGDKFRYLVMQNTLHTYMNPHVLPSVKPLRASVVVSGKGMTPYHRHRLLIIHNLLQRPNVNIDVYGRANLFNSPRYRGPLPDLNKENALKDYSYSIAFENSSFYGYLSEKFVDCIVNYCMPITNNPTSSMFPKGSYHHVDFNKPVQTVVDELVEIINSTPSPENDAAMKAAYRYYQDDNWNFCESIYRSLL